MHGNADMTPIELHAIRGLPRLVAVPEPVVVDRATRLQTWAALAALALIAVLGLIVLLGD